jgi:hypothetical protein
MAETPDTSVRHPETSHNADYYTNKKATTESGHEFEFDDTKGHERIRIGHKSGSYIEWSEDGRKTESIVGQEHKYISQGSTCTIDGNSDHKYNGNLRTSTAEQHIEINGVCSIAVSGEYALTVQKGATLVILDDLYIVCKNLTIETEADANFKIGGSFAVSAASDINLQAGGVISISSGGAMSTKNGGTHTVKSPKIDLNP